MMFLLKKYSNKETGLEILKDFLNSILFPKTQSIIELKYFQKEILSNSNLKQNKGTRIVDDVCVATIKYIEKNEIKDEKDNIKQIEEEKLKEIIIDFEMESNYQIVNYTTKYFDYSTEIQKNCKETWVIVLQVNRSTKYMKDKDCKSSITKKYNINDMNKELNYIKIYEIYLNDLYSNLDQSISIFENEEIKENGKEWIKLFTIELWANTPDEARYCFPSNLKYKGKYINKAISKLSDILEEVV